MLIFKQKNYTQKNLKSSNRFQLKISKKTELEYFYFNNTIFIIGTDLIFLASFGIINSMRNSNKEKISNKLSPILTDYEQEYQYIEDYCKNEEKKLNDIENYSKSLVYIFDLANELQKEFDTELFLSKLSIKLPEILNFEKGFIIVYSIDKPNYTVIKKYPIRTTDNFIEHIPVNSFLTNLIVHKKILYTVNYSENISLELFPESNVVILPLIANNKIFGMLSIKKSDDYLLPERTYFNSEEISKLQAVASQVGINLQKCILYEKLQKLAIYDSLTGLNVHIRIKQLLKKEMIRAAVYNTPLSVLMIDVDYFKKFNDNYGHPAGDEVLRKIAYIIKTSIRDSDYAGRYGGEEFIIVLPSCDKENAIKIAKRLNDKVSDYPVFYNGIELYVTVSIGVANYPIDTMNINEPENLIQLADKALYSAKSNGRNRVESLN